MAGFAYQMENTDLQADATGAEGASTIGNGLDLLSNGFRPTTGTLYLNGSGSTYIYLGICRTPICILRQEHPQQQGNKYKYL